MYGEFSEYGEYGEFGGEAWLTQAVGDPHTVLLLHVVGCALTVTCTAQYLYQIQYLSLAVTCPQYLVSPAANWNYLVGQGDNPENTKPPYHPFFWLNLLGKPH